MAFCKNCGTQLEDGAKFCASCGAKQSDNEAAGNSSNASNANGANSGFSKKAFEDTVKKLTDTEDNTTDFSTQDANDNKLMAVLSYLSWLVLIPLIGSKSPYVRFHVNQGLMLAIGEIIWNFVLRIISSILYAILGVLHLSFLASIIVALLGLVNLAFFIMSIIGIINAATGKAKRLPIVGSFNIIK